CAKNAHYSNPNYVDYW
nr:immunoglobulin heavy chain junction region [Mus musculus]